MENKESQLLTITEIVDGGQVNLNGGKSKGLRKLIKTKEGVQGQAWVMSDKSLKANYPLNELRYYDLKPLQYMGKDSWKFSPKRADDISPQEKEARMRAIASDETTPASATEVPSRLQLDKDTLNAHLSGLAVLGAAILVASGKENADGIVPRALLLKRSMQKVQESDPLLPH